MPVDTGPPDSSPAANAAMRPREIPVWSQWLAWAGLVFAGPLLIACARGDLWLDEIWSFLWVQQAATPWDVLGVFHHDNNHPANTWWLMFAGPSQPALVYRLPAVGSGILSLFLMGKIASLVQPAARGIAVVLGTFSFPLVLYFSEARGYAPAVACSLAAGAILLQVRRPPSMGTALLFWLVCAGGMLSHGTFLIVLASLGAWKAVCLPGESDGWGGAFRSGALWFAVPGLTAAVYYFGFFQGMQIGGGPKYDLATVFGHFFGYALALPTNLPVAFLSIVAGGAILCSAMAWGFRGCRCGMGWLFALLLGFTALTLWIRRPEILYFRYFLVLLPFFYIALAALLARMAGSPVRALRIAAPVVIAAYCLAQSPRLLALLSVGRGGYQDALRLVAVSPFANKVVTSDHFRNEILVEFFRGRNPGLAGIPYLPFSTVRPGQAGWLIRHSQDPSPAPPEPFIETDAGTFRLAAVFPFAGVSGWHWFLYRAEPATAPRSVFPPD